MSRVSVMAIGDDTALIAHHFRYLLNIIRLVHTVNPVSDLLFVNHIDKGFAADFVFSNLFKCTGRVVVKHKNQTENSLRSLLQVISVDFGLIKYLLVRTNNPAKILQFGPGDKAVPLIIFSGYSKILNISINALIAILFYNTL